METLYISSGRSLPEKPVAGTVGFFDGVHRGHRFLTDQLKSAAQAGGLPTAVITFPVHPKKVLFPEFRPELLNSFEEKLRQLATTGVDLCYVIDFTTALSQLTAREFIRDILYDRLKVQLLLAGYDHRFGKNRAEGVDAYIKYGQETGMEVREAEPLLIDNLHVSSTRIREALSRGNVEEAARLLSYPYQLVGTVTGGNRIGRTIGFPTANIVPEDPSKVIPAAGIYSVRVHAKGQSYKGMLYVGSRPSIEEAGELRIEVNLLDFTGDLYGQTLVIDFIKYLRDDQKFDTLEGLRRQLERDLFEVKSEK